MNPLARWLDPAVIQQIERLDLRARLIVEGFLAGLHRSPFQGLSLEFAEHRKYVCGDDPRSIDWNVFARTDRLFVRKRQAETHLACHLLIDASASMGLVGYADALSRPPRGPVPQPAHMSKLDYAIHIAAAIGYLVTHQQDAIGVGTIRDGLESLLPARTRRAHLAELLATLAALRPSGVTGLPGGLLEAGRRIAHRGLIIVLSDLLSDEGATRNALVQLRQRGHDVVVMHILAAAELDFAFDAEIRLEDPESGEALTVRAESVRDAYLGMIGRWRDDLRESLMAQRIDYVPLDTATPFDRALIEFLVQRARRA
ncbi:MAG: hypothetical protein CHACPFDD_03612 [Phycisphaerae bacterium]|nr:hypothetical protein [Phycisphaerae bacterium]